MWNVRLFVLFLFAGALYAQTKLYLAFEDFSPRGVLSYSGSSCGIVRNFNLRRLVTSVYWLGGPRVAYASGTVPPCFSAASPYDYAIYLSPPLSSGVTVIDVSGLVSCYASPSMNAAIRYQVYRWDKFIGGLRQLVATLTTGNCFSADPPTGSLPATGSTNQVEFFAGDRIAVIVSWIEGYGTWGADGNKEVAFFSGSDGVSESSITITPSVSFGSDSNPGRAFVR